MTTLFQLIVRHMRICQTFVNKCFTCQTGRGKPGPDRPAVGGGGGGGGDELPQTSAQEKDEAVSDLDSVEGGGAKSDDLRCGQTSTKLVSRGRTSKSGQQNKEYAF